MSRGFGTDELLDCYRRGVFPMADDRNDPRLFLIDPDIRGVILPENFHVSRSLKKTVRRNPFRVTIDTAFSLVMEQCAAPREGRETTWINSQIVNLYSSLHRQGYAHSVECWQDDELVGGLYGVSLGAAFFGESMFSTRTDASKIAMVHLMARLNAGGFQLLDTQFQTEHLSTFGAVEIERDEFRGMLSHALSGNGDFYAVGARGHSLTGSDAMQLITQTS
ncbi:MAG: leucyl/phenylalanyl-tRNA--protein transferase [Hirschia sp.]|nr:leucyl/phenylalanyl-tRNA--protein transferase [Hirschia sp.]MBF17261.1 leucyl/phenylalanyl-tRNA--protein transferase [Hirschia sp.]